MEVVLYLRYSSDKQNEQSIEGQERICRQYCESHNMKVINTYVDRALSASKDVEKRLAFQKMIKDSEKQKFEAVVVYKLDRFSRSKYDAVNYKYRLKKNGVSVISATENISNNPEGVILESVLEGMAEFYSLELSQKVTRGMNETALKGNSCGGSIPLGYKIVNKKYTIDDKTAPIVKEAFERYANGDTIEEITDNFNKRGFRTTRGSKFCKNSFSTMFKNEKYIGIYKYKDIRIEDGIPPIIDKKLFYIVQKKIEAKKQMSKSPSAKIDFLLTQKLFCGHCGAHMIGDSGTGKSGKTYAYYTCQSRKKAKNCDKKSINKEWLEKTVVENTVKLLTPDKIEEYADKAVKQAELEAENNVTLKALNKQLAEIEKAIGNLMKLVEHGSTLEQLFTRLDELAAEKKECERLIILEEVGIVRLDKEKVILFLSKLTEGDINSETYRRRIINMFVNSVTVWDEPDGYRITTTYNLTSIQTAPFKCSDNNLNVPPKIDKFR